MLRFWWTNIIVLYLNALSKLQNPKEASRHPALMGNCWTCSHMSWYFQSTKWFVISPFQVMCEVCYSVTTIEVPIENKVTWNYPKKQTQKYSKNDKKTVRRWTFTKTRMNHLIKYYLLKLQLFKAKVKLGKYNVKMHIGKYNAW